jgi:putative hydroxymethylpyrimidine transporter CytX
MRPRLASHGIEPVPPPLRRLHGLDHAVLWGSLSIGLLVLVTGSYIVPALGLWEALAAIALGSALGGLVLGAIAHLAARLHVPGMVLTRAPLGLRGSLLPTALNVAQGFGWAVFEVIVIAHALGAAAGGRFSLWAVVATVLVTALALGGPLVVVRRVLRAIGIPLTLIGGVYLTGWSISHVSYDAIRHGTGGLSFFQAVDLSLAIPISWAPLVADYARFASDRRSALAGTALGTFVGNAWFTGLGALLVLAGGLDAGIGVRPAVGALVLGMLALAEVDKPFADLYSTVVSIQNARPRWPGPVLTLVVGAIVGVTALTVPFTSYSAFLLLIGAVFVPLTGVLLAHAVRIGPYDAEALYRPDGPFRTLNLTALGAWLAGVVTYEWVSPTTLGGGWLGDQLSRHDVMAPHAIAQLGASIPSFVVAGGLMLALVRQRLPLGAGEAARVGA